ncbi:MAG: DUF4143 domain-containing protein [Betaproteobacteria bacterium]|nr:DUF4143 domain-containing protein [Betaproteobacteria bacterium]
MRNFDHLEKMLTYLALRTARLLSIESLGKHLAVRRETVQNNLAALERLFLVRRLPAWHTSDARRLVKASKIHLVDGGIASTLAGLVEADWLTNMDRFGPRWPLEIPPPVAGSKSPSKRGGDRSVWIVTRNAPGMQAG